MNCDFSIQILRQNWLNGDSLNDLCSHGEIELWIGNQQIARDEQLGEDGLSYGISETALGLLRTLRYRHTGMNRVAEHLIQAGSGAILMMGCNIGIDWTLRHNQESVCISNVVRYDSNDVSKEIRFPNLKIEIAWINYAKQVIAFAKEAKTFFENLPKNQSGETIEGEYDAFWLEYDNLLENWEIPCERDRIRRGSYLDYHA